jgi:hypothetical protein
MKVAAPLRAGMRAVLLNTPVQRYLGNQAAAGLPAAYGSLPGLLTAAGAASQ